MDTHSYTDPTTHQTQRFKKEANYIGWQNNITGLTPFWQFFKPNIVNVDVVQEVCSCTFVNAGCKVHLAQHLPRLVPPTSQTIVPASLNSGSVAQVTFGVVGPAPAGGVVINLTSSNPTAFPMPSFINVPAGSMTSSFAVTAGPVTASTQVQVTASYYGTTSIGTVTVTPQH